MVFFLHWQTVTQDPYSNVKESLIVYANKIASVVAGKLFVHNLSKGHGLLGYQFKWIPVDEIGWILARTSSDLYSYFLHRSA